MALPFQYLPMLLGLMRQGQRTSPLQQGLLAGLGGAGASRLDSADPLMSRSSVLGSIK